jgi:DNA repair exonuclease SbcCD ATPase subunit
MGLKEQYQEKIEAQLNKWSQKFQELQARGETASAAAKAEIDKQVADLQAKLTIARMKLQELRQAGEETWETARTSLDEALEEVSNTWADAVGKRQVYQEKLETQLKEWSAKIEGLKARAEKATAERRVELTKQIEKLRGLQESAQARLKKAREVGGEAWEELKTGLDKTVGEIKTTWEKVAAKFRKEGPPGPDKP